MSVGVPPRNRPVFDPITGRVVGMEPNPDFYAFFGLGGDGAPPVSGGNPAGLGSLNPDGSVVTPFTDIGVDTGILFDIGDFATPDEYHAAISGLIPEYYRDSVTGQFDPARSGMVDYRGRPAGMFNQGMEGVALDNWARNHPQEAAALYWAMAPAQINPDTGEVIAAVPHLTEGEQRQIALAIGPDLIEAERMRLRDQAGLDQSASDGGPAWANWGQDGPGAIPGNPPAAPSSVPSSTPSGDAPHNRPLNPQPAPDPNRPGRVGSPGLDIPLLFSEGPQNVQDAYNNVPFTGDLGFPPIAPVWSYDPAGGGGYAPAPPSPYPSGIGFNAGSPSATLYDPPPVPGMARHPVTGEWYWPELIPPPVGPPNVPY